MGLCRALGEQSSCIARARWAAGASPLAAAPALKSSVGAAAAEGCFLMRKRRHRRQHNPAALVRTQQGRLSHRAVAAAQPIRLGTQTAGSPLPSSSSSKSARLPWIADGRITSPFEQQRTRLQRSSRLQLAALGRRRQRVASMFAVPTYQAQAFLFASLSDARTA